MRIGIIAPPWVPVPPPAYGGTEAILDVLARGFHEAGHDVLLYASGDSTCPVPRKYILANAAVQMGAFALELQHAMHAYEEMMDFDIIHDHTLAGLVFSERYPHLKVVTDSHSVFSLPGLGDAHRAVYQKVADRISIIAISHCQAAEAEDIPIARVIHHGMDITDVPFGNGEGDYYLFLGRISPHKGIAQAIEVAERAGVRLLIAAKLREMPELKHFRDAVKPHLSEDIVYVGEVGRAEKYELLSNAKALINPVQWSEPFGLTMIEALACGTPVIATNKGAAPEIVKHGETGFICSNVDEMIAALDRVDEIDRKTCRKEVDGGYFSAERMVGEYIEFFQELTEKNGA